MSSFIVSEKFAPSDHLYDFTPSLFNTEKHLRLQSSGSWLSFFITSKKRITAAVHFLLEKTIARSPCRAPYGGIEASEFVEPEELFRFIIFIENELTRRGITQVFIKMAPLKYDNLNPMTSTFLADHGFRICSQELSSIIQVTEQPLAEYLHRSQRRNLAKCRKAGLVFHQLNLSEIQNVYQFIEDCRRRKGYILSMTLEQVVNTSNSFADDFFIFGVFDGQKLAAASISIRTNTKTLYDFYHDHDAAFDSMSPVVMLVDGIYSFCRDKNLSLLDLGTSSLNNTHNFSLLHFKLLVGAQPSPKFTFEKNLS